MSLNESLEVALHLAREAAAVVERIYREDFAVETKRDGSPVTEADRQANEIIMAGLRDAFPDDAILSEEAPYETGDTERMWLVDPLDGTSDFAGRTDDFAVMIGLCCERRPVLGVVAAPALGRIWYGGEGIEPVELHGDERRPLKVAPPGDGPLRVVSSRKHPPPQVETLLKRLPNAVRTKRGGVGVKIGVVATGEADVYLHPSPGTHLWDCCAPEAILRAAGGEFTTAAGDRVVYDPQHTANPAGLLAAHPQLHGQVLEVLRREAEGPRNEDPGR